MQYTPLVDSSRGRLAPRDQLVARENYEVRKTAQEPELDPAESRDGTIDSAIMRLLPHSHSMDLHNDPRFFASNVIEKRLAAFTGLSVIASLTTGTALNQCFALSKNIHLKTFRGIVQISGFFTMSMILFMSLTSTLVFVYQSFFTHRLMTAGPTGFELASAFYLHEDVVKWRHFAVHCLGVGLPLLLFSTGCTIFVKFSEENDGVLVQGVYLHPLAILVLTLFTLGACLLLYIGRKHERLFTREYDRRVYPDMAATIQSGRSVRR